MDVKKLAEFAGFVPLEDREDGHKYVVLWEWPDGTFDPHLPDFPNDLNACFRWLVPKLYWWSLKSTGDAVRAEVWQLGEGARIKETTALAETPALALCRAIEQLIDKGGVTC